MSDYEGSMDDWQYFVKNTKNHYGVDMSVLTKPFSEEQKKYYLQVGTLFQDILNLGIFRANSHYRL